MVHCTTSRNSLSPIKINICISAALSELAQKSLKRQLFSFLQIMLIFTVYKKKLFFIGLVVLWPFLIRIYL